MSQIYNDSTKRPNPKENQLEILGSLFREFMHFVRNSTGSLGFRRECCWALYLSLIIHPKSCCIFPLKVATTLLSGSGKGAVGVVTVVT